MAEIQYGHIEPVQVFDDDFVAFVGYAARMAVLASAETAALRKILAAQGIKIDPKEFAEACLSEQETEIDRLKVESPTVARLVEEAVYSD